MGSPGGWQEGKQRTMKKTVEEKVVRRNKEQGN
jgi:hypothetical protein